DADGIETTHWVQSEPVEYASFNIGVFKTFEFAHEYIPPVRIYMNQQAHQGLPLAVQRRDPEAFVASDVSKSLSFFQTAMGPLPAQELSIAEIPYLHGQAFPGMIHLSFLTFGMSEEEATNELFRAHEVAHQWWGVTVRPAGYRDQWLSEGMAEFSALWYMEALHGDNEETLKRLRRYRDRIRGRRDKALPTGLGPRVVVGGDDEDHQIMIYEKGAWIGWMLRHLLTDYDTGDDRVFRAFLQDVMRRYRNRPISTRQFQAVLEDYVGADMGWFFDQWVQGTGVPEYRFAHRGEALEDGRYKLEVRIRQRDVPDDFQMFVPLLLDFGEGRMKIVRLLVAGPETTQELLLPAEPTELTLNPLEAVLAEVRT
ncbi:MAG: hypothetical protein D6701_04345, partial [Gemmatimonadetes bacterium]